MTWSPALTAHLDLWRHPKSDEGAHFGNRRHIAQMAEMQRRLAYEQHETEAFLEHDIGCAGQQGLKWRLFP
jgi:hypothetical protein